MRPQVYMNIAREIATESTCISRAVGAIIVKNGRILSHGYNGVPSGMPHCGEVGCEIGFAKKDHSWEDKKTGPKYIKTHADLHSAWSQDNEIHAEQNAICYAARAGLNTEGADMYVTLSPCWQCCKFIVAAGIKRIFYSDVYERADDGWAEFLIRCGVEVKQL